MPVYSGYVHNRTIHKGHLEKTPCIHKFGFNSAVGTTAETIWEQGGLYSYLAAASVLKISSSDANDTSAGSGARTLDIYGLDSSYAEVSETITLNGQTAVNTTNSYLRVYRMVVRTAGSGGANAGVIYAGTGTVTAGVPANVYATITAGNNQTLMALYTIPAGYNGVFVDWYGSIGKTDECDLLIFVRPFGEVFQIKEHIHLYQDTWQHEYGCFPVYAEKTDIEVRGKATAGTMEASAGFDIVLYPTS